MRYIARITFMAPYGMAGFRDMVTRLYSMTKALVHPSQSVAMHEGTKTDEFLLEDQMAQYGKITIYDMPNTEQLNIVAKIIKQHLMKEGIKERHIKIERKEKPKPIIVRPNVVKVRSVANSRG